MKAYADVLAFAGGPVAGTPSPVRVQLPPAASLDDESLCAAALADPRGDAESRLLTQERVARALDVLSRCSASARTVFRLAYGGEGLSHTEVAQRAGLSLQRVRQILCEVRAKLRTELEGEKEE